MIFQHYKNVYLQVIYCYSVKYLFAIYLTTLHTSYSILTLSDDFMKIYVGEFLSHVYLRLQPNTCLPAAVDI